MQRPWAVYIREKSRGLSPDGPQDMSSKAQRLLKSLRLGKPELTTSPGEAGLLPPPNHHPNIREWPALILGPLTPIKMRPMPSRTLISTRIHILRQRSHTQAAAATISSQLSPSSPPLPGLAHTLHLWQDSLFPSDIHLNSSPPLPGSILPVQDAACERCCE